MDLKVDAHCRYQIRYHVVWGVKYRRKILLNHRTKALKQILSDICFAYDWELEAMGTDQDHVHVFVGAHPKTALAKLVQVLKSKSAVALFDKYPEIKKIHTGLKITTHNYAANLETKKVLHKVLAEKVHDKNILS